jgi:hypothetical protein
MAEPTATSREGIREDGTVEGYVVETHHLPLESARIVAGEDGYLAIVGDGGGINYEVRVPLRLIERVAALVQEYNDASWGFRGPDDAE